MDGSSSSSCPPPPMSERPDMERGSGEDVSRSTRAYDQRTDKEELFFDFCHILLLSSVGSCLMEGIGHSLIEGWRSQLMFDVANTYTYLTLFAVLSIIIRHLFHPDLVHKSGMDWRWQKVFGQLAAQLMMGAILVLVEDVSGRSLDEVTGLALSTCIAASVWSGGVELVVITRFGWQNIIKPFLKCIFKTFVRFLPAQGRDPEIQRFN